MIYQTVYLVQKNVALEWCESQLEISMGMGIFLFKLLRNK